MTNNHRLPSLRNLLELDALTCSVMGAALIAASGPISAWTEVPAPLLFWAGILLLPIAAFMAVSAQLVPVPGWAANIVLFGNCSWVFASLALPLAGLIHPNAFGWVVLVGQTGVVTLLALAEFMAASHLTALTERTS